MFLGVLVREKCLKRHELNYKLLIFNGRLMPWCEILDSSVFSCTTVPWYNSVLSYTADCMTGWLVTRCFARSYMRHTITTSAGMPSQWAYHERGISPCSR